MARFERKHVSKLVPMNSTLLTIILVAVAVVNSATLGYDSSVMNGLSILPSYSEYFHLNDVTIGLNNAAVWAGGIIGLLLVQPVPDKFGRKNAILVASIITIVGIILQAAAQHIAMFVVARVIIGIGTALSNISAPPLLAELLPPRQRSRVLGFFFSCYYVGGLLSAIINYGSQNIPSTWAWRLPSLLQFIPSLLALSLLPFIPESPRWLVINGREEHAHEVLIAMSGDASELSVEKAADTLVEIKAVLLKEQLDYPKNPYRELIDGTANRKRLLILVVFGTMINTLGNFIVSFYLTRILTQAGITSVHTQTQINVILQCWSFAIAILGSFMLDIIGRRVQTMIGLSGMIATLYTIGGLISKFGSSTDTSAIYGTVAVIFLFQGFYAFAITPMTSLYPTEICQYKLRAAGTAVFRFWDSGFGLLGSFCMSLAMSDLQWKFYFINASWNMLFLIFVYFFFVETKGLKLEEIAEKFHESIYLDGVESGSDVVTSNVVMTDKAK